MDPWPEELIFRRTAAGDKVLTAEAALPTEYRRILAVIEGPTHSDVVRGLLRQFPDSLLADWLSEVEELGFVDSARADPTLDLDFTGPMNLARPEPKPATPDDTNRLLRQAMAARKALDRGGAYLSPDRLENRPPITKAPAELAILIVEDDPDQAALANLRVSTAGYTVRIARNCRELVEELRGGSLPDLVLLDVMLPDGNGFDVLMNIRRHPKLALLPVVMLTVLTRPEEVQRGLNLGADGYITKPYSKKIITDTLRSVLKHS